MFHLKIGDSRLMVTLGFTSVQTMFLRKHNELARALRDLNHHWDNNKLYEEARKINIAFFQDILYTRWLPLLFGTDEFKELFGPIGESSYNVNVCNTHVNSKKRELPCSKSLDPTSCIQ